jgi:hypothetical protein
VLVAALLLALVRSTGDGAVILSSIGLQAAYWVGYLLPLFIMGAFLAAVWFLQQRGLRDGDDRRAPPPMTACPHCNNSVSPKAEACPACGHPIVAARKSAVQSGVGFGCLGIIVFVVGFIAYAAHEGSKMIEEEKAHPTCTSDYTKCTDNKVVERHQSSDAINLAIECKFAAKDAAKFGDPDIPFLGFSTYYPGHSYIDSGTAVLIEKDATFNNGFRGDGARHRDVQLLPAGRRRRSHGFGEVTTR